MYYKEIVSGSQKELGAGSGLEFRDVNAWIHLFMEVDTTQASASNRAKLYINGVNIGWGSGTGVNQNTASGMQRASATFNIGMAKISGTEHPFEGLMSHVYFIDGAAYGTYSASTFGETDSVTGEWKIKTSPTISSYGYNGFLVLKDGNTITDQSPNSNNFGATGTITNALDCPNNIMANLNPLSGSLSNNTLANLNNTLTVTSGWRWKPSTLAPSTGKYYAEFKPTSGGNIYTSIGATPQVSWDFIDGETIGAGSSSEAESVGYLHSGGVVKGNSTQYTGSTYATNDIIGVAMDLDNFKIYFSKNGVWQNSGDPTSGSTGTGAVSLNSALTDWSLSPSTAGSTVSCNYGNGLFGTTAITTNSGNGYAGAEGASKFTYQPPTGYSALNTKGMNQ